jgi:arylsulfatase A-like enzyme
VRTRPETLRTRRERLAIAGLLGALAWVTACTAQPPPITGPDRIIFIVVDTLRADRVGAYGSKLETPWMDRLAEEGQLFPNAVSAFHMTPMSMGSLFTGKTPSLESGRNRDSIGWSQTTYCGMARFREHDDDTCVPEGLETLAESMQAAGYWTLGVTANPLLFDPDGFSQGFDEWLEIGIAPKLRMGSKKEHAVSRTGRAVNDAVFAALRDRPSDRFFLYLQYLDVHDWILVKESYRKGVERFDAYLGELIGFLEAEQLLEGSVIVLTSDHGERLGEPHPVKGLGGHLGNPSYQTVLEVPLIVRPAVFPHTDGFVRGEDIPGMLRSLVEEAPRAPASGTEPEHFVSEGQYQTYRSGRWKSMWPRDGGAPALFDLAHDPREKVDVAVEHRDVLAAHRARIDALSVELGLADAPAATDLDAESRERLRVLGYLDEEAEQEEGEASASASEDARR